MHKYISRHLIGSIVHEHQVIIATDEEWRTLPESLSTAWDAVPFGGYVVGLCPYVGPNLVMPQTLDDSGFNRWLERLGDGGRL